MAKRKKEKLVKFWALDEFSENDGYRDDCFMQEMPGCCGIIEMVGLDRGRTEDLVAAVAQKAGLGNADHDFMYPTKHNLFVFTDATTRGYGRSLAAYVKKHRLGAIYGTPTCLNPRHNSQVQGWFWKVSRARLKAWAKKNVEWREPDDEDSSETAEDRTVRVVSSW